MQQIISVLANAGGVGKTTLSVHLAYAMAQQGYSVALIDLDPQRSLDVFLNLPAQISPDTSIVQVFDKNFSGTWNLTSPYTDLPGSLEVCQAHPALRELPDALSNRKRREYILADRLKSFPLPPDLVILDCPATLGILCLNALAASTGVLVPMQLETKAAAGVAGLVEWWMESSTDLQLSPRPPILGIVPNQRDKRLAVHNHYLGELPEIGQQLGIKIYPPIRATTEFKSACAFGVPLQRHQPNHPACQDFNPICEDLERLIQGKAIAA